MSAAKFEHAAECLELREYRSDCTCGATAQQAAWNAALRFRQLELALRRAEHERMQLDYPLFVRVQDEPRKERHATPEEVAAWKAAADTKVAELVAKQDELLRSVGATR